MNLRTKLLRTLLAALCALLFGNRATAQQPIQVFYVPLPEEQIRNMFLTLNPALTDTSIRTTIAITAAGNNTRIYYDHWEDGYEADLSNPVQPTSQIWGDANLATGAPPGCILALMPACDTINAGRVITLQNDVFVNPRNPATVLFDGRDKFGSTLLVASTQAGWGVTTGTILADAIEIFPVNDWGTSYEAPGGEGFSDMFQDARFIIMAQRNGTIVRVDVNDDGIDDIIQTLNEGQTLLVDPVLLGTRVNANLPILTSFLTGDVGATYEMRWFSMVPRNRWSSRYIAPVATTEAGDDAVVLLYNPHTTPLDVTATTRVGVSTVTVPAGGLVKFFMPLTTPVFTAGLFEALDGRPFFAISSIDDEATTHDWGYTMLPASTLAPAVKAGWAPGSDNIGVENSSPIWVTAASATTLNVDWNDDGIVDLTVPIGALESVQLRDPDGDQTGTRVFTTDGTLISAAWGQDPLGASPAAPALDLGTSVLPMPDVAILKNSTLATDLNGNGLLDPGDTLFYSLFVLNTGVVNANNVVVTDSPDPYTTYALNTTLVGGVPRPDDLPPATPFPLDEFGVDLGTLTPGQGIIIRYERAVGDPLPSPQQQIINTASVTYGTGIVVSSSSINPVTPPQFQVTKTSNLTSPALPGQVVTYTISILNNSPITQTAITVTDPLPAGTTYVAQSTTASVPLAFRSYRDEFNAQAYNNSNGTINWAPSPWVEPSDGGSATGGDVFIANNVSNYQLRVQDNGVIYREANLSGFAAAVLTFDYRRDSLDSATEWVDVEVSSNGGGSWTFLDRFLGPATDPGYTSVSYDITAYRAANTRIRFIANPAGMGNGDAVWFENVLIATPATLTKTNQAAAVLPLVDGDPPNLVLAGDGFGLAPNQTLTVTYQVRVDDPLNPFLPSILNQATINSAQSLSPTLVTRLDPVAPGSILGDRVWLDVDGDGVQDIGEVGLSNVRVRLFRDPDGIPGNGDEVLADQMFTDGNGTYLFDRVYPPVSGTYYVEVDATTLPSGLSPSPGNNNGRSASLTITGLQTFLDLDFGYTAAAGTAIVGDRVWSDADGDGIQDPSEIGIGGVTVNLMGPGTDGLFGTGDDVVVGTRTTASDGTYLFVGVTPAFYRIDVTDTGSVLTGYTLTFGPDPSTSISLTAGAIDVSRDFGYRNPSLFSISDAVWNDADADGVRDVGEVGISGVTIALRNASGNLVGTTLTDANGNFQFTGVPNGNYTVVVTDTGGVLVNAAPTTVHSTAGQRAVTVSGANVTNTSFGYRNLGTIGELVWSDANGDGVRDPSEPGIGGVTIRYIIAGLDGLFGTVDDSVIGTGTTAANGTYRFNGVPRGYYRVQVTDTGAVLAGFTQTGDPDTAFDAQGDVPLLAGAVNLTMNFGYRNAALSDVSGNVFSDTDLDGVRDLSESGISSVTLNLTAAGPDGIFGTVDDLVLATTSSNGSGNYVFVDVPNGNYRVVVTDTGNILNGYTLTSGLDAIPVSVTGANVANVNFGYARNFGTATIGSRVWLDANRDGVQNPSEDGLGNITLNLYTPGPDGIIGNGDDVLVATETTDTQGYYLFTSLPAGEYYVDLVQAGLPLGLGPTVGTTDPTGRIQLANGQNYNAANFGYASASGSAIGDSVFFDANGDGFQNAGEVGIGGVGVTVSGPSGTFNVTTNPDGSWLVAGLAPGTYVVTINTATLPPSYNTTPTNGPAARAYPVSAGLDFLRADFGFNAPPGVTGTIGDTVFFDANGNGTQNAGEGGITGVTLRLLNAGGVAIATTTTGANGAYDFVGVPPGNYTVEVTDIFGALTGLNLSAGTNPSSVVTLAAGADVNNVDFGYAPSAGTGSIGGFIWHDDDASGAVNGAESSRGIQGVTVNLYLDVNANGVVNLGIDNLIRTTTTDVIGEYQMFGLPPGAYLVDVTDTSGVLAGFSKTSGVPGVDNNSQADPYAINLVAGTTNFTADFGYVAAGTNSIQGTTFFDVIGDGLLNGTDAGIGSVTVYLYRDLDADGVLDVTDPRISVQLSNASGNYNFSNIPNGNFIVAVGVTGTFLQSSFQTTQLLTRGVQPVVLAGANSTGNHFGFNITATLVTISRFDAYEEEGQVVVEWVTGSEVGTLGFYLFRWDDTTRGYLQVNNGLLPGLRAPEGGLYRLVDETAPRRGRVTYVLFEAEEGGGERRYGPYTVQLGGRRTGRGPVEGGFERRTRRQSRELVERAEKGRARRTVVRSSQAERVSRGGRSARNEAALKIAVPTEGVYFLSVAQIATAFGRSEADVGALLSRGGVKLTNRGQKVSWVPSADGSGLTFYGEGLETLYASENVYWLQLIAGLRAATMDGTPRIDGSAFYMHPVHLEQDTFPATLASTDPDSDFWYWNYLLASYSAYNTGTYTFDASAVDASGPAAILQVHVDGATSTTHRLRVRLNGTIVGEDTFQDVGARTVTVEFDPSLLVEGTNTVSVQAILETGVAFDVVYVDSLDAAYPRRHQVLGDALSFRAASAGAVVVHGFAADNAVVLDITRPTTPMVVTGVAHSAGAVRFEAGADRSYFTFSGAALRTASVEWVDSLGTLRSGGAEYVVITPESLAGAAAELTQYREAQGLKARVVTLESIHDELGFGIPSPMNVQSFLRHALDKWHPAPRFVVLIGKGTYDYKDVYQKGDNLMTPLMAATPLGLYASDNRLADVVGGDGVPDVMIGRIPVLSDDELRAYVAKLEQFEGASLGEAIFLADNPDAAGNFTADSNEMASLVPGNVVAHRIHLAELPIAQARAKLFGQLAAGAGYWNYIGHGGLDRFADEGLVFSSDVPLLTNGTTPILASLTCTVGRFEIPGWSSLAEALVMKEGGGAIAAWSPSGLSYNSQALILNRALIEALYDENTQYLGEAIQSSLTRFSEEGQLSFMLSIYNLLGDPATRLR